MPLPDFDSAYILDISKPSTAERLDDLLGDSLEQEPSTGSLVFNEVIVGEKFIRVVRMNSKTR